MPQFIGDAIVPFGGIYNSKPDQQQSSARPGSASAKPLGWYG
jgi:hypothetical protein